MLFYFVLREIVKLSNRKAWANASGRSWFWLTEADCTLWYLVIDTLGKKEWQRVRMFLSDEKWHFVLISLTSAEGWKVEILKALAFIGLQAG